MDREIEIKYLQSYLLMEDTPQHIKDLQLKIWLSKPPMDRLRQFLIDNEKLYKFWNANKKKENDQPIDSVKMHDKLK